MGTWIDRCRIACKTVKHLGESPTWDEKPNRSGWQKAFAQTLDEQRVAIPGLYFQGEYHALKHGGHVVTYALMHRDGKDLHRVFMLEVYPSHILSHRDTGVLIFGPHLHLGDHRIEQRVRVVITNIALENHSRWLERFRRHAQIYDGATYELSHPFSNSLF